VGVAKEAGIRPWPSFSRREFEKAEWAIGQRDGIFSSESGRCEMIDGSNEPGPTISGKFTNKTGCIKQDYRE
jgi:hypothetical protein